MKTPKPANPFREAEKLILSAPRANSMGFAVLASSPISARSISRGGKGAVGEASAAATSGLISLETLIPREPAPLSRERLRVKLNPLMGRMLGAAIVYPFVMSFVHRLKRKLSKKAATLRQKKLGRLLQRSYMARYSPVLARRGRWLVRSG